jgi:hypothetical protein
MRKYLFLTIISIALFALAFKFYIEFQDSVLGTANLVYSKMETQFFHSLEFAILCAGLPFIINRIWKITRVEKLTLKIGSIFIFLITVSTFIIARSSMPKSDFQTIENINLPIYIVAGSIIGFIAMFIFLKIVKMPTANSGLAQ